MKIGLLNGPNINMLGKREPEIYGDFTLDDIFGNLKKIAGSKHEIIAFQSNSEGELINFIQLADEKELKYVIFNPGAYTHTSIAIRDAISSVKAKFIEVHISNIYKREEFRQKSLIAPICIGQVSGFGIRSYEMALHFIMEGSEKDHHGK
jgi:3-dehydroquinate dehydratase II